MNKKEHIMLSEKLSVLIGKKLNCVSRAGTMINLGFGEMIQNKAAYKKEDGSFGVKECLTPRYAMHIDCAFRITCGKEIFIAKNDIFMPNSLIATAADFDEETFEWDKHGNNGFDEKSEKHFTNTSLEFVVKRISANKFGDLEILFTNDIRIEVFVDTSEAEESWRFFEAGNNESAHIIVTGNGVFEE